MQSTRSKGFFAPASRSASNQATFPIKPYKLHKIDDGGPNVEATLTRDQAIRYYTEMSTIRRIEASANALYKDKSIRGFCHLYTGNFENGFNIYIIHQRTNFSIENIC